LLFCFLLSFELKDQTNIQNLRKTVRMNFEFSALVWPIINIALLLLIMYVVVKLVGKNPEQAGEIADENVEMRLLKKVQNVQVSDTTGDATSTLSL
jgi:hypothetical protein